MAIFKLVLGDNNQNNHIQSVSNAIIRITKRRSFQMDFFKTETAILH
jgi:hypothetical protein